MDKALRKKKAEKIVIDKSMPVTDMKKKAKSFVLDADQVMDGLESNYFDLVQKFEEACSGIKEINKIIATMPLLKEFLSEQAFSMKKESPVWKKAIVQMFTKVIDLGIAVADAVIYGVCFVYAYTLEPIINAFRQDVGKKMQVIEQEK